MQLIIAILKKLGSRFLNWKKTFKDFKKIMMLFEWKIFTLYTFCTDQLILSVIPVYFNKPSEMAIHYDEKNSIL